jgi:hypothetical protein
MTAAWKSQLDNGDNGEQDRNREGLNVSRWTFWQGSNNSCPILSSAVLEIFYILRKDY